MFATLMNTPGFAELDFSSLRVCIGGGMAVQPAVAREWREVTGGPILQGYGLTETSPAAIVNPIGEEFYGAIGLPISSTDVIICDDAAMRCPLVRSAKSASRARRSWKATGNGRRKRRTSCCRVAG